MIKSVIFKTFLVLTVVSFVVAREIPEADGDENIGLDSILKSADDSHVSFQNSTVFDMNMELEEENSPDDLKFERLANSSPEKPELKKAVSNEQLIQNNKDVTKDSIAVIDIESSTHPTEEKDRHAIRENTDENSNEKEDDDESFENGGHRHRNGPDEGEDVKHIFFALEPIDVESMQKSGASSTSNENSSNIGASRHGRPDILLGGRRVLKPDLLKNKIVTAQALDALSKIGSSRSFPSDLVPPRTNSFNGPMHYPSPHDSSGVRHSPSLHDNTAMYYKEFIPIPNSKERMSRLAREYSLDLEANSYPYTPAENPNAHWPKNPNARTVPSHHLRNLFDHNYSPVLNPIYGGVRHKRNDAIPSNTF